MLLDNQIDILEREIGRGEYNRETTRVCYRKFHIFELYDLFCKLNILSQF